MREWERGEKVWWAEVRPGDPVIPKKPWWVRLRNRLWDHIFPPHVR